MRSSFKKKLVNIKIFINKIYLKNLFNRKSRIPKEF